MKKHIPNFITILSLLSGCLSIISALESNLENAVYFIFIAAFFDFLDGFFARLFDAISEFGKVLDSLSDMVSFGIAPAIIMYKVLIMSLTFHDTSFNHETANAPESLILYSSLLLAVFSAIRLANFTISKSGGKHFKGLPTPACALLVSSISFVILNTEQIFIQKTLLNTWLLIALITILCILMVSKVRFLNLKFSNFKLGENLNRYLLLLIALILIVIFKISAVPAIIAIYILISVIENLLIKKTD